MTISIISRILKGLKWIELIVVKKYSVHLAMSFSAPCIIYHFKVVAFLDMVHGTSYLLFPRFLHFVYETHYHISFS